MHLSVFMSCMSRTLLIKQALQSIIYLSVKIVLWHISIDKKTYNVSDRIYFSSENNLIFAVPYVALNLFI